MRGLELLDLDEEEPSRLRRRDIRKTKFRLEREHELKEQHDAEQSRIRKKLQKRGSD